MAKHDDKDQQRRRWAEANIASLLQQRAGLDRKIGEFRAFLAMLDAADSAIGNGHASETAPLDSLPDLIESVLREANGKPLSTAEVTEAVEKRGFKARGKTPLRMLVGIELPRQVMLGRRDIVRVEPGRYASGGVS